MSDGADALGAVAEVEQPIIDTAADADLESTQPTGDESIPPKSEEVNAREEGKADARTLPKEVQRLLKQIRENDPANAGIARQLQDAFFREQAYQKLGKIEDIQGLKAKFEELGGDEGITTMRSAQELIDNLDRDYAEGNPKVLEDIPEEGFKKLVSPALDRLERLDPETYARTMQPHLVRAIEGSGLPNVLDNIEYLLRRNDPEEAMKHLNSARRWLAENRQKVDELRRGQADPKLQDLTRREQALKIQEENSFKSQAGNEIVGRINTEIQKIVDGTDYKGLTEGQKKHFVQAVYSSVEDILRGDKNYQTNVKAAIQGRDLRRLTGYVNSTVSGIATRAARELKNTLFPNLGAPSTNKPAPNGQKKPPTVTPSAPGSKPIMLSARPDDSKIDWAKTGDPMMATITHKAWTKTGQYVTWR
jgi:hypothetical protein